MVVAQNEASHKTLGGTMVEYFQNGVVRERSGNRAQGFQPLDSFQASDGWVVMGAIGDVYSRMLRVIGLDPADPRWESARTQLESIEGIEFDAILRGWISVRTVKEGVGLMAAGTVPCSPIMSSKDIAEDPQNRARGLHVERGDDEAGRGK